MRVDSLEVQKKQHDSMTKALQTFTRKYLRQLKCILLLDFLLVSSIGATHLQRKVECLWVNKFYMAPRCSLRCCQVPQNTCIFLPRDRTWTFKCLKSLAGLWKRESSIEGNNNWGTLSDYEPLRDGQPLQPFSACGLMVCELTASTTYSEDGVCSKWPCTACLHTHCSVGWAQYYTESKKESVLQFMVFS